MNIGQAAQATGLSAKMIRYYETIGLVTPAPRSDNSYRVYGPPQIQALGFIRRARTLGFSIDQIRRLLALWHDDHRNSAEVKAIALGHVAELSARIADLQAMRASLIALASSCHGDQNPDCPILDNLAPPQLQTRQSA